MPKLVNDDKQDENKKYPKPFEEISDKEYEAYKQYQIAREQYYEYVNKLSRMESITYYGTDNVNKSPKKMNAQEVQMLEEISGNLLYAANKLNTALHMHEKVDKLANQRNEEEKNNNTNVQYRTDSPETKKKLAKLSYQISLDTNRAVNDISMIASLDMDNLPSYLTMHRQGMETVIDAGDASLETAGDATSTRMILRYVDEKGNIKKGYFTKDVKPFEMDEIQKNKFTKGYGLAEDESINQRNTAMSDVAALLGMDHMLAKSTNMVVMMNGRPVHGSFMENAEGFDRDDIRAESSFFNCKPITVDYNRVVSQCTDMMVLDFLCANADRHAGNHFYRFEHDKDGNPQLVGFQGIDNDLSFLARTPSHNQNCNYMSPLRNIKHMTRETSERILNLSENALVAALAHNDLDDESIRHCVNRLNALKKYINGERIVSKDGKQYTAKLKPEDRLNIKDSFTKEDFDYYDKGYVNDDDPALSGSNPIYNFTHNPQKRYNMKAVKETLKQKEQVVNSTVQKMRDKNPNAPIDEDKLRKNIMKELDLQTKEQFLKNENAKKISDGIKGLQNKLHMDVNVTIKAQAKRFETQFKRLRAPRATDIKSYEKMYTALKEVNDLLTKMAYGEKKPGEKARPVSSMMQNLLAEKYKKTEECVRNFVTDLSDKRTSWNDRTRLSIAASFQKLCDAGREQREFQIREFNELMGTAYKQIQKTTLNLQKVCDDLGYEKDPTGKLQTPENPDIRYRLAKSALDATAHISSYIGNIIPPDKTEKAAVRKSVATLLLNSHLEKMKTEKPDLYKANLRALSEKPDSFDKLTEQIMKDKNFTKLLDGSRATLIINEAVQNSMLEKAEELKCFSAVDKSANKIIEADKKAQQKTSAPTKTK